MSWYVNFYLCWQDKDGKIRPLGPYDYKGEFKCVRSTSRSFTTDLNQLFNPIPDEAWTEELEKEFTYEDEDGNRKRDDQYMGYLPLSELPTGDWIKDGYFLIDDIDQYIRSKDDDEVYFDDFYGGLSPEVYIRMVENELKFGPPKPKKDCEGEEYIPHSVADYSFFMYPDYQCKEWEAFLLRMVAGILDNWDLPKDARVVVVKTEG